jgi:hypothetical protein
MSAKAKPDDRSLLGRQEDYDSNGYKGISEPGAARGIEEGVTQTSHCP